MTLINFLVPVSDSFYFIFFICLEFSEFQTPTQNVELHIHSIRIKI